MRTYLWIALFLPLLAACGNADQGKLGVKLNNSGALTTSPGVNTTGALALGTCKNFQVYSGTDSNAAQAFGGSSACPSTSSLNIVRVRVNAYFPTDSRYCLVPLSMQGAYNATCFTVNGQSDVTLSTEQFTAVAFVKEGDLGAYMTYLRGQSASYPPMAYAQLR